MVLLVFDLKKPGRFFFLLTKPNLNSWLVLGGYVLMIFGVLLAVWLAQMYRDGMVSPWVLWSDGAVCHRVCGLFRFSFRPGARAGFLAKPAAVLAPGRARRSAPARPC